MGRGEARRRTRERQLSSNPLLFGLVNNALEDEALTPLDRKSVV